LLTHMMLRGPKATPYQVAFFPDSYPRYSNTSWFQKENSRATKAGQAISSLEHRHHLGSSDQEIAPRWAASVPLDCVWPDGPAHEETELALGMLVGRRGGSDREAHQPPGASGH
jgi:hypothetical protein